jgi:5'-nucleotidase/UDP-sugar diphosphatase
MTGPTRRQILAATLFAAAPLPRAMADAPQQRLTFLHVNDVYEISPVKGQGGFGPLMTLLQAARAENPLTVTTLGGDFLSPSVLSGLTKGAHMVDLFNAVGVDLCVFGNHEFDFGPDVCRERIGQSAFPWLGSNVLGLDGKPFGGAVATATRKMGDYTVGFFGVLTPETVTLSSPGPDITFPDVIATAQAAVDDLTAAGANIIVALTHLHIAEDRALAQSVKGLHMLLGGHDHDPIMFYEGNVLIFKAGYDAHYLGVVDLDVSTVETRDGPTIVVLPSWEVRPTAGIVADPAIQAKVEAYEKSLDEALGVVVGQTETDLDSQRATVRLEEAAIGNLFADAIRDFVGAEIGLTNGGGIRGDRLYPAGTDLTRKDVLTELPFGNTVVLLEISGADLRAALENGVSRYEEKAGRFPQVSGMVVAFDPALAAGSRILDVTIAGAPLDDARTYRLATNDYVAAGGDGYAAMTAAKAVIDASAGRLMATVVTDYIAARGKVAPKVEGRILRR